jgi:hypothetical protein
VAFCNNDTVLPPGWAGRLVETADAHPQAGIVVPALTAAGNDRTIRTEPGDEIVVLPPFSAPPSAVIYVMPRSVVDEIGAWGEEYLVASGEDVDIAFKVWVNGLDIVADERVLVDHVGKGSASKLDNWQALWAKNRGCSSRSGPATATCPASPCDEQTFAPQPGHRRIGRGVDGQVLQGPRQAAERAVGAEALALRGARSRPADGCCRPGPRPSARRSAKPAATCAGCGAACRPRSSARSAWCSAPAAPGRGVPAPRSAAGQLRPAPAAHLPDRRRGAQRHPVAAVQPRPPSRDPRPAGRHRLVQRPRGHAARGRRWYQAQFDSWNGEPVLGEASVGYLKPGNRVADVVDRIHHHSPTCGSWPSSATPSTGSSLRSGPT